MAIRPSRTVCGIKEVNQYVYWLLCRTLYPGPGEVNYDAACLAYCRSWALRIDLIWPWEYHSFKTAYIVALIEKTVAHRLQVHYYENFQTWST